MTHPSGAAPRPAPPGDARLAVAEILRKEAEVAKQDARPLPRRYDYRPAMLMALVAMSASLWLPELPFVRGAQRHDLEVAERVASARLEVFLQAQRVTQYRINHGRLPAALADAGDVVDGVAYQRLTDDLFRLTLITRDGTLSFRSDDSPERFLGGGLKMLGIGGQR